MRHSAGLYLINSYELWHLIRPQNMLTLQEEETHLKYEKNGQES